MTHWPDNLPRSKQSELSVGTPPATEGHDDEKSIEELCKPLSAKVETTRFLWGRESLGVRVDQDKYASLRRTRTSEQVMKNIKWARSKP